MKTLVSNRLIIAAIALLAVFKSCHVDDDENNERTVNVYVVGMESGATVWKNGEEQVLNNLSDGTFSTFANFVFVVKN